MCGFGAGRNAPPLSRTSQARMPMPPRDTRPLKLTWTRRRHMDWTPIRALSLVCCFSVIASAESVDAPDGWTTSAAREEIAPRTWVEQSGAAGYALGLAGRGQASVDGRWQRRVDASAGKYYVFRAEYQAEHVATPTRSVLARVTWLDAGGKQVEQPEFPLTSPQGAPGEWRVLTGTYQAPPKAAAARLELHLRWAPEGKVLFRAISLKETEAPAARKVRLASINHRPRNSPGPRENLEAFGKLVEQAAG